MKRHSQMTRKTRFILFAFLAILFLLVSPLVVFYSQGYRFDFENKKITQTGAFYFRVWPRVAEIYLNGKLTKKTDFLLGRAFIDDLLPKKYKIEIKKEGYHLWQKDLEIKEKFTTEGKNIFLVPKDIKFSKLEEDIENFFFAPDNKKVILKKITKEGWVLNLFDLRENRLSQILTEIDISEKGKKTEILDIFLSSDSKKIFLKVLAKEQEYFIFEIDKKNLISLDFLGKEVRKISFDPENSQRIFFMKNNNLFNSEYLKKEISEPILEDLISYQISNGSLFWLNKESFLVQSELSGRKIRNFNFQPLALNEKVEYQIMAFQEKIFLKENGGLYFFDAKKQSLEKISENVKDVKISPDFKKIAYFTGSEIWILFLKDIEDEQPQRTEDEKLFLTRFSEKIGDVFWWTNHYLIFNVGDLIKIAEINDRDRINIYDLSELKDPAIFWSKFDKKLYILSKENLYSSEKLIR